MTLSGATTPGQVEPGSNGKYKGALHSPKLKHYWSHTIKLFSVITRTLVDGILPLCRDAVGVFCIPNRLDQSILRQKTHKIHVCIKI